MLFAILIGCGEETTESEEDEQTDSQQDEIRVAYPAQPPSLDPFVSTGVATTDVMWHVYETLLVIDADFNIQPMLAESYEQSEDGQTVTFYLREGVQFHNGEEMTAEDVVASMNHWLELSPTARSQFSEGDTFEFIDEYTVELQLSQPLSTALSTISYISSGSFAAIMPREVIENASENGVDEYIGTGPFEFSEWRQDEHIHLAPFADYQSRDEPASGLAGEREALVDLYFIFTQDPSTQVSGIQSGEYDVAHEVHRDSVLQLEDDSDLEIYTYPDALLPISFNKKEGLFTEVKARQAVATALDMEAILTGAFTNEDYYHLNHSLAMYHQTDQWDSDVGEDQYNENDHEKAQQLLEDAGYDGEEITIITDREYAEHYDASVIVQEQLNQLGMNVNLEVFDWSTLLDRVEDENAYDIYIYGFVPNADPLTNNFLLKDYAGWTDSPKLDEILDEMQSQPSIEDAQEMFDALQAWYWDYMPVVKVGDYDAIVAVRNTVEGYGEQNELNRPIYWNVSKNE